MTCVKISNYKGAHILILNEWQVFIYIIYYKRKFFANEISISKRGEYTNKEYVQALDGALVAAKSTIDIIRERSAFRKFFTLLKNGASNISQRGQADRREVPEGAGDKI